MQQQGVKGTVQLQNGLLHTWIERGIIAVVQRTGDLTDRLISSGGRLITHWKQRRAWWCFKGRLMT